MIKIGFVDDFLDEWHANNYPTLIENICKKTGLDCKVCYAWAERPSPFTGMTSEQWSKDHNIPLCATIDELCEKSDCIILLSPDTPHKHLPYAKEIFKHKKPTFIDKTFADSYVSGKEIFDTAAKYGTPFYSTSALRYAEELDDFTEPQYMTVTGCGVESENYYVHFLEIIVRVMHGKAVRVRTEKMGRQMFIRIFYDDGRIASIFYAPVSADMPFTVSVDYGSDLGVYREVKSDFFTHQLTNILTFFTTGKIDFDTRETLEVMRLRDGLMKAEENVGQDILL